MKVIIITYESKYDFQAKTIITSAIKQLRLPTFPGHLKDLDTIEKTYIGRGGFFLALIEEKVIGVVALQEINIHTAELRRMYVLPTYQGKGQLLFNALKRFAIKQGYKDITLNTFKKLQSAQRFYEKNGFEETASKGNVKYYKLKLNN